jgi:hypothetical protein
MASEMNYSCFAIPAVPYDKDEYRELIEQNGGLMIDSVGKEKENKKDKVFLISDNYARTVKYIYCLAASIPCVSYRWIQRCLEKVVRKYPCVFWLCKMIIH